jgi:hypothetical protein
VASTEGIDVTNKLALTQDEIALELQTLLGRLSAVDLQFWQPAPVVDNVVSTPALQVWVAYRTLETFYADAYFNQLNDRYQAKRDQFHEQAARARDRLIQIGVGIARNPLPRPAAPQLTALPGAGLPDGTYYIATTWVNSDGEESVASPPASITTATSLVVVTPATPPAAATGWNIYAGVTSDPMTLQNATPAPIGQSWHLSATVSTTGQRPGNGQSASYLYPVPNVIQRG